MSRLKDLQKYGQSIWLDYIKRSLMSSGELATLIHDDGIRGLTSNPSIFEMAIVESSEYSAELETLARGATSAKAIYEQLAITDIQIATDQLHSTYLRTMGRDGFVSFEVSPELSRDVQGTLEEARRLWKVVGRENLMIKVPGTSEGLVAIETLISEGINVNVTLLFDVAMYDQVAQAYASGLTKRLAQGGAIDRIASVASFFVSRVDTSVDALLEARIANATMAEQVELKALLGKAAIANAKIAYEHYLSTVARPAWKVLAAAGAQTQRLLWASTGTKNPDYRDVVYVEELVGNDTVNTMPPKTLEAFRHHGRPRSSLTEGLADAHSTLASLAKVGISMPSVSQRLLENGQLQFVEAFRKLLRAVDPELPA
jgi:transaldolase